MSTRSEKLSVVVPAFNEENRLSETLPVLWKEAGKLFQTFEIIVVDDGSTDKTAEIVVAFGERNPGVRLIRYEKNRGKGYAVRTGVLAAAGDLILFSDADLSTPFGEVVSLLAALDAGADVAIGSRAQKTTRILKRQPFYRILMGKTFNKVVQFLATPGLYDTQCGFKLFPRAAAVDLFSDCRIDGFGFDVEVLFLARKRGMLIREVGVRWENSPESKVHPVVDSLRMLRELAIIRQNAFMGRYGDFPAKRTRTDAVSSE